MAFSTTSALTDWSSALYSIIYTSIPTFVVGTMDKHLSCKTLLKYPKHYGAGYSEMTGFFTSNFKLPSDLHICLYQLPPPYAKCHRVYGSIRSVQSIFGLALTPLNRTHKKK
ncbi:hypothetical protein LguiB_001416 [Lonicera macranthoides]